MCTSFPHASILNSSFYMLEVIMNTFLFADSERVLKRNHKWFAWLVFSLPKKKKKTPINDRILRINILEWSLFFFSFKKKVKKLTYTFPEQQISLQVVAFIISKSRKGDLMSSETFFIKSCRHLASLQRPHWLWWTNTKANAVARFCILSVYQFPEWVVSTKC